MINQFDIIPINCIWAKPDELIDRIKELRKDVNPSNWIYERIPFDLNRVYSLVPPKGGAHLPHFMVWQPGNMAFGSVLIPNYRDGMIQLMRHLNKKFHIRYFSAFLAKNYKKEGFCTFTHADEAGKNRVVQVIRDLSWNFYEEGDLLPFEKRSYYMRSRIYERLTPTIIKEYLKSMEWDIDAEAFGQAVQRYGLQKSELDELTIARGVPDENLETRS